MKHVKEELSAYLDGELDAGQVALVESHLAACVSCRQELESMRGLQRIMDAARVEVPTRRMWLAIQARLDAGEAVPEPGWREKLAAWWPRPGLGGPWPAFAGALALALVVFLALRPGPQAPSAPAQAVSGRALASAAHPRDGRSGAPAQAQPAPRVASAPESTRPAAEGQAPAQAAQAPAPRPQVAWQTTPFFWAQPAGWGDSGDSSDLGQDASYYPPQDGPSAPPVSFNLPPAVGGKSADGSWNWAFLAQALDQGRWARAGAELEAARLKAGSAEERSFAASGLNLLSQAGQPLEGAGLAPEAESWTSPGVRLVVLQARQWRFAGSLDTASFQGDVMTRLAGLRSLGSDFRYLQGGRAVFSAGTEFTRLAGDARASVVDAAGKSVDDNQIVAPRGAVYDFSSGVLKLQ